MIKQENRLINLDSRSDHGYTVDGACTYYVPTFLRDINSDAHTLKMFIEHVSKAVDRYERAARAANIELRIDDGDPDSYNTYEIAGDAKVVRNVLDAREFIEETLGWFQSKI